MKERRFVELDVLRGFAVFLVILFHYTSKYNEVFDTKLMSLFEFKYGHYGVHLFFIISGYVIFLTINKINSGKEFIFKRFFRLYPTFWLCLVLTFLITTYLFDISRFKRTLPELFINLTMIPSLFRVRMIDGVYWSLLFEIEFYFIIYFLYIIKKIDKIEWVNYIWLVLSLISIFFLDNIKVNTLFITKYCFLFIAGINFYKLKIENKLINHIQLLFCFVYVILIGENEEVAFTALFFGLFYLIIYGKMIFLSSFKVFIFLGYISYPLYLIHQFLGMSIINKLSFYGVNNYFLLLLIPTSISILISWLITIGFEGKIVNSLRSRVKKIMFKN